MYFMRNSVIAAVTDGMHLMFVAQSFLFVVSQLLLCVLPISLVNKGRETINVIALDRCNIILCSDRLYILYTFQFVCCIELLLSNSMAWNFIRMFVLIISRYVRLCAAFASEE